jgi:serine/threonine protein kinase
MADRVSSPYGITSVNSLYDVYQVQKHKATPVKIRAEISNAPLREQSSSVQRRVAQLRKYLPHLGEEESKYIAQVINAVNCGKRKKTFYLKKKGNGPTRSLIISPKQNFVLEKGRFAWEKVGSNKRVTIARYIPSSTKCKVVTLVQKVNRTIRREDLTVDIPATAGTQADLAYEIQFASLCKKFLSQPLIWFTYKSSNTDAPKTTTLEELFPNTLASEETLSLPLEDIKSILIQLVDQLRKAHEAQLIFGDIKLENASWAKDGEANIRAKWIDFGFAGPVDQIEKLGLFPLGFYGSVDSTPQEVLNNPPFKGNPFPVEVWSFGCMVLDIAFPPVASWAGTLQEMFARKNNQGVSPSADEIRQFTEIVTEHLHQYEQEVNQLTGTKKVLGELALWILKTDPAQRPSLLEIRNHILSLREP